MYTLETLKALNQRFCGSHRLSNSDVEMANKWVEFIESDRSETVPKIGDRVRWTNKYGEYYHYAHIEKIDEDGEAEVCERPYVPFIFKRDDNTLGCSTSGGAWNYIPVKELKYVGKEKKSFCDWGSLGACADGAVEFEAEVSVWEYVEPGNPYAPYTTKDYKRAYVSYCVDKLGYPKNGSNYRYFGDGFAFETEKDFNAWLKTYKAVTFQGNWDNQTVVFYYRKKGYLISKEEWDALDLPVDTRQCNGIIFVKVKYDNEQHIVHEYRYTNDGSANWRTHKPYELAREKDYE